MGTLGQLPATIRPGWGGYTYPIKNPVTVAIATRVNIQLCTLAEAQKFLGFVLFQGDIIPDGVPVFLREETEDQLYVDSGYLAAGYLPFVLEFAGPTPGAGARDQPMAGSQVQPTAQYPYAFSVNIGEMYASAPQVPGSVSSNGRQAFRSDFKVVVQADGSFAWRGLDQPTWQGNVSTATGSNPNA